MQAFFLRLIDNLPAIIKANKSSNVTWGFRLLISGISLIIAAQPGVLDFLLLLLQYECTSNLEELTANTVLLVLGVFIMTFGSYIVLSGTKRVRHETNNQALAELYNLLNESEKPRLGGVIQKVFQSVYKRKATVFLIDKMLNSNDPDSAPIYYKLGKQFIDQDTAALLKAKYHLEREINILSVTYWAGAIILVGITLMGEFHPYFQHYLTDKERAEVVLSIIFPSSVLLITMIKMIKPRSSAILFDKLMTADSNKSRSIAK